MMLLYSLVFLPICAGLLVFVTRHSYFRRVLMLATAIAHFGLTVAACRIVPLSGPIGWFGLDALGALFLFITSALFVLVMPTALGHLTAGHHSQKEPETTEGKAPEKSGNTSESIFIGCMLLFLGTMSLVALSRHLGLLWVAVEATTLVGAPLIYFHRHPRSLEATWKYLMICSVGIALALLANFFLAAAAGGNPTGFSLALDWLINHVGALDRRWVRAAVILFFVGYGTKLGLAPMHTWLPDAHSEAPSAVSALLSGALLNCSFLALLRVQQICRSAGLAQLGYELFLLFGLLSITVAAVFIVRQADYKRMLAYSSVESMGVAALGVGLSGAGISGALLHIFCNSFAKAGLFILAGTLLATYKTKLVAGVQGALKLAPRTAFLWLLGFLALSGTPPFGLFFSKYIIISAAVLSKHFYVAAWMLLVVVVVFIAMSAIVMRMVFGSVPEQQASLLAEGRAPSESWAAWLAPAICLIIVLMAGLYQPSMIARLLKNAAVLLSESAL